MGESVFSIEEIIAAQSTPQGNGSRGVVRVSGHGALRTLEKFISQCEIIPDSDRSFLTDAQFTIQDWNLTIPITLWFWPAGKGYTGQESLEIHLPGSPALLDKVLQTLFSTEKIRCARQGEFTLRAFLNGRVDLPQAEAVLGVIDAQADNSLEAALKQLSGNLSTPLRHLRKTLIETLAHLEAGFDFTEEDISFISQEELLSCVKTAALFIKERLKQIAKRSDHRQIPRIILTGPSNSGKSSLFNVLVNRRRESCKGETAIVSDIAGTTRDYLEKEITLFNHKVLLTDTAGFEVGYRSLSDLSNNDATREEFDSKIGKLTRQALNSADLFYQCHDAFIFLQNGKHLPPIRKNTIIVLTKVDLLDRDLYPAIPKRKDIFCVSSLTKEGLDELCRTTEEILFSESEETDMVPGTVARCRESFQRSLRALRNAENLILNSADEALIAYELRNTLDEIGRIIGVVRSEDILDSIFSRFCIGK